MERKIKVAQYGCGKMSIPTMKYVYDHGAEIVCAFNKTDRVVGKDIGELMGTENKRVVIDFASNAEQVFRETEPDICIIETMALMPDCEDIFLLCAKMGINAISTCEEALYPWNSRYKMTKKIDELAKQNNCSICGSGAQDMGWTYIIDTVAGASNKLTKIKGAVVYNSEDYGIALAHVHGVGLTKEEFAKKISAPNDIKETQRKEVLEKEEFLPCYVWNSNGWLCEKFGLTVKSQEQIFTPTTSGMDLYSHVLGKTIPAGDATGLSATVITETEEGITIESACVGKVYEPDEEDVIYWTLYGEPDIEVVLKNPDTVAITCASVVNRLPDVINAEPGFTTTDKLPTISYRWKPLNEYVK